MSREECIEILINESRGVLALMGDEDYPYALPMSHVYVDGKIYFHGAMEGHKIDALNLPALRGWGFLDFFSLNGLIKYFPAISVEPAV